MVETVETQTAEQTNNGSLNAPVDNAQWAEPVMSRDQMSWGEKYKHKAVAHTRDWGVNYFINFIGSALLTYMFQTSKYGTKLDGWIEKKSSNTFLPKKFVSYFFSFLTKTQLLLCGGHALLPIIKDMSDNRRNYEFVAGEWLDSLQEKLGFGNEASKRSRAETKHVRELLKTKPHTLSPEDEYILAKHYIGSNYEFIEHRKTWGQILKARGMGILGSTATSVAFTTLSSQPIKALQFNQTYEKPLGKWIADKARLSKVFGFKEPHRIGEYFVDDAILTAASKMMFERTEKKHAEQEAKAPLSPEEQRRREILAAGPKSPRTHAETTLSSSMSPG